MLILRSDLTPTPPPPHPPPLTPLRSTCSRRRPLPRVTRSRPQRQRRIFASALPNFAAVPLPAISVMQRGEKGVINMSPGTAGSPSMQPDTWLATAGSPLTCWPKKSVIYCEVSPTHPSWCPAFTPSGLSCVDLWMYNYMQVWPHASARALRTEVNN